MATAAANFKTDGWTVAVDGLVNKPKTFALNDILKIVPPEERIYRMRCVEGWSMVIPWVGFAFLGCLVAGFVGISRALNMQSGFDVLLCLLGSVAAFGMVFYIYFRRN